MAFPLVKSHYWQTWCTAVACAWPVPDGIAGEARNLPVIQLVELSTTATLSSVSPDIT